MGEHFLERQCLLKCAERSLKEHSARHDKDHQPSGGQPTSESRSNHVMVQPEHAAANTAPSEADQMRRTRVMHEKKIQDLEGVCSKTGLLNAPDSTVYCSPGLQEIFDRWPSMSEQPCPHAATSHPATPAPVPDSPQASKEAAGESREHVAARESDPQEEQLSGCEPEDAAERPGSANDLIPPTQERPPVTPRVRLTTSSVQLPIAAPPPKQSTPSAFLQPKAAAPKLAPSQSGQRENVSGEPSDLSSYGDCANSKGCNGQSVSLNRDRAPPSSPRAELPSDMADKEFSLQLSPDPSLSSSGSFTIIDVASDRRLFKTFINEWKTKERYSLALACEKREPRQQPDGEIGWKPQKGTSNIQK